MKEKRGVSPTVGVVVVIAIVIGLSLSLSYLVFGIGTSSSDSSSLSTSTKIIENETHLTVEIVKIPSSPDSISVLGNGSELEKVSNPTVGSSATVQPNSGDIIAVVQSSGDTNKTLRTLKFDGDSSNGGGTFSSYSWKDSFDDGSYKPEWTVLSESWDASNNNLKKTSGGNDGKISRTSNVTYGTWNYTYTHNSKYYGSSTFLVANTTDISKLTGYSLRSKNTFSNYAMVLQEYDSGSVTKSVEFGSFSKSGTRDITVNRYKNGTIEVFVNGVLYVDQKFGTSINSSTYIMLEGDDSGHTWDDFNVTGEGK